MGMKLTTIMKVEFSMGIRTSLEASNTTSSTLRRWPSGFRRFSRRRLNTLSTSTIASSTSEPIAIAIPPMLIVFMLIPLIRSTMMVIRSDSGMVTSEISVVLTFIRNRKSTRITNSAPSISACRILPIEASMKSLWRKMSVLTCTSDGSVFAISAILASRASVRSLVETLGCLVTVSRTPGLPSMDAVPVRGSWGPVRTSAMSRRVIGRPSAAVLTTASAISSTAVVEAMPRIMYSLEYS